MTESGSVPRAGSIVPSAAQSRFCSSRLPSAPINVYSSPSSPSLRSNFPPLEEIFHAFSPSFRSKGCTRNGVHHGSETEWIEGNDPCRIFACKAGVITESRLHCYTPCSDPIPPPPGQCCPVCAGKFSKPTHAYKRHTRTRVRPHTHTHTYTQNTRTRSHTIHTIHTIHTRYI